MVSITISVPEKTRELMKKFPEINWSGLVGNIIENKVEKLALRRELLVQLSNEEKFNEWAVNIVREGRKNEVRS